jgi:hypothetical protein
MPRLPAAIGLGLALLLACGTGAGAQDGWNPFKERDQARERERAAEQRRMQRSRDGEPSPQPPPLAPMDGPPQSWREPDAARNDRSGDPAYRERRDDPRPPWAAPSRGGEGAAPETVQRTELQPLPPVAGEAEPQTASDNQPRPQPATVAAAPLDPGFWRGVDAAGLGEMVAALRIPPRSEPLSRLWQRLLSAPDGPPSAGAGPEPGRKPATSFDAIRIEALYRSGLIGELRALAARRQPDPNDPADAIVVARTRISFGDRESGCALVKGMQSEQARLAKPARHDFLLLAALCGTGEGDTTKAGLAAELLRSEAVAAPTALAVLDALASGNAKSFRPPPATAPSLLDYRFLQLVGAEPVLEGAEPALLAVAAAAADARNLEARIAAAEAALAIHVTHPADLADAYRAAPFSDAALAHPLSDPQPPPLQRALLFQALERERAPNKKAQLARALLDETRRAQGPYMAVAAMLAPAIADLRPGPDLAWFTGTAIEIHIAAQRLDGVRAWAGAQGGTRPGEHDHWLALADIAAADWPGRRGEHLPAVERLALSGRLPPEVMHRLVTVLDTLDYQIPIPLWEAASKTQQPTTGFLPQTGVLSRLQQASREREQALVILLAIRALGPDNGETAHMIALGDTIRALKHAGFGAEARRLGLEALYMSWPRGSAN